MAQNILLVEDSEALRRIIPRALERAGYDVLVASSGAHALMLMDFKGLAIDLLIADINLQPGMSGAEVALEVLARRPGVPVLYISGAYKEGGPVEHFLAKPFTMDELLTKVRAMLSERPEKDAAG